MRLTIFGATGLLGRPLVRAAAAHEVTALGSKHADIRDAAQVRAAVEGSRPDWIILAAAYTDVDGCETNPQRAMDVNCQGAVHVAEAAKEYGSRLLFVSTDYVFDGVKTAPYEVDDPRAPRSVYGKSKAEAEIALLKILAEGCVARTSWLFGTGGKCFPDTILKLAASRDQIDVVDDQRGCPTYAPDLARALVQLCEAGAQGIVHVTNRGACTWFEFAKQIVADAGMKTVVRPTTSDKFVRPAPRPRYSVLSSRSLEGYGITTPCWEEALSRYLRERLPD
jgi:dTDP-4-dehydrorhamnose reductase